MMRVQDFTVKTRLYLLITFFALMLALAGTIGMKGVYDSNESLRTVYFDRVIPLGQLSDIKELLADRVIQLNRFTNKSQAGVADSADLVLLSRQTQESVLKIKKLRDEYLATYLTADEKIIADEYSKRLNLLINDGILPVADLISKSRFTEAETIITKSILPDYQLTLEKSKLLTELQIRVAKQSYIQANSAFTSHLELIVFFGLLANVIGLIAAWQIVRKLTTQLNYEIAVVKKIAHGDFSMNLEVRSADKTSLVYHLKKLQKVINEFVDSQKTMTKHHANGFISENMWADAFPGTFGEIAQQINELVGSHIAVKMRVVDVITKYASGDFSVDMDRLPGEKAKITAAIDNVKKSLLSISTEIKTLCDASEQGDFSKRSNADDYEYMFKDILTNFNNLIETCDTGFNDVLRVAQALAQGDLTQLITRDYPGTFGKVKAGVNSTVENLKELVGDIQGTAETISSASLEITTGNNDLSHRTEEQAASLEQTAASMQQLTTTVQQNSENAKQANQLAIGAADTAAKGVNVVKQVIATMSSINDSSQKISEIISVIDGIAFQTNILALNAAVEAARAGEQGRGFAVVAGEVRSLAQRAASAAYEIKTLIGDSEEKVGTGAKLVNNAGQTMQEIVTAIRDVSDTVAEISAASVEQSNGIGQINQAINQMDEVTQQNAALVEQVAATSESMQEQTQNLTAILGRFNVGNVSAYNASGRNKLVPKSAEKFQHSHVRKKSVLDNGQQVQADSNEWVEF